MRLFCLFLLLSVSPFLFATGKCPDYHLDGSLSKLYLVVCCDGLCFQTVEVPVFETEAQVCQFLESQGREVPEKYKPRSACDFGCSLVDPDVLYVYPGHQLPVDWHMDLKIGYPNTHMVYVFFKGRRKRTDLEKLNNWLKRRS